MEQDKTILCRKQFWGWSRASRGHEGKDDNFICLFSQITEYLKENFSKHRISCARDREPGSSWPCSTLTSAELSKHNDNKPEKCYPFTLTLPGDKSSVIPCPKQDVGADALLNSLSSFPCCPDQYSCCSFTCLELLDKESSETLPGHQLWGGSDVCRRCDLCRRKGDTRNRDTKARDCPALSAGFFKQQLQDQVTTTKLKGFAT